jgi:hypothetical protein
MGRFKLMISAACAAVVLSAAYTAAQGTLPDRATVVTISAPVSVPGMVLPAGEYVFRLADTQSSRNVVQIYNRDRTKLFTTLIAISALRDEPSGEAVITFRETPSDQPPALRYWYYAGEKSGQEFAYPKDQAIKIARASRESVMAIDSASADTEAMSKAEMHRIDPNSAEVTEAQPSQPAAPTPTPTEPQAAAPTPTPAEPAAPRPTPAEPRAPTPTPTEPAAAAPVERPSEPRVTSTAGREVAPAPAGTSGRTETAKAPAAERELPRTAGELPLVVFLGFAALLAAFGARALRRRVMM